MVDNIIIIVAVVIFPTTALTTSTIEGSRDFFNHRHYQLLAAGLIKYEDHVDESNVCHEVCTLFVGMFIFIIVLIFIDVSIYLGCNIGTLEEEVLLDPALLSNKGSEI